MANRTLPFPPPEPAPRQAGSGEEVPQEPEGASLPGSRGRPLSISDLNAAAKELLEGSFPDVWLQAEISNFKAHSSGHFYFSLKDARSQIGAVMFRGVNAHLRFRPADGLSVLARGRLTLYEARGSYQINLQWMEPLGAGSLQVAFEQLKAKLKAEGLFDQERKRPLPALPRRVGVVTSPTGAALRDILRVLQRRHAGLHVVIAPCRVQGDGAAREIVAAIEAVQSLSESGRRPVDVLIVGRGGGSLEDLWAFNEEIVARAIASCRLPVISAVGHETDVTIADFAADLRAPTPSAAAEMVVKSREELLGRVDGLMARLPQAARLFLMSRRARVEHLARSRAFQRVESAIVSLQQRCDESIMRMGNAILSRLGSLRERAGLAAERLSPRSLRAELANRRARAAAASTLLARAAAAMTIRSRERLRALEALLDSLSPLSVLERGYAIARDPASGRVLTDAGRVAKGESIEVTLARGVLDATVTRSHGQRRGGASHDEDGR